MAIELIAELATAHHGSVDLAKKMIDYAVVGGAHTVKTQAYRPESVNPSDPQAQWLRESALSEDTHLDLKAHAEAQGAKYFASVFDKASVKFIAGLCGRIKVASTEATSAWWQGVHAESVVSWPWGVKASTYPYGWINLATVPLYPTPVDALYRVSMAGMQGWSDHCAGTSACQFMIAAHGAQTIEVHVSIPGEGRNKEWDKTQDDLKRIRDWMEEVAVMRSGVSKTFRNRWLR